MILMRIRSKGLWWEDIWEECGVKRSKIHYKNLIDRGSHGDLLQF